MKNEDLPQLSQIDQLELENIMLHLALEQGNIEKHEEIIVNARKNFARYQERLSAWNKAYNERLKPLGLDMSQIGIEADTGKVYLMSPPGDSQ